MLLGLRLRLLSYQMFDARSIDSRSEPRLLLSGAECSTYSLDQTYQPLSVQVLHSPASTEVALHSMVGHV